MKEFDITVSNQSHNFKTEALSYYWQELKDGTIINKPVDKLNHLMDAARYAIYTEYKKGAEFFVI